MKKILACIICTTLSLFSFAQYPLKVIGCDTQLISMQHANANEVSQILYRRKSILIRDCDSLNSKGLHQLTKIEGLALLDTIVRSSRRFDLLEKKENLIITDEGVISISFVDNAFWIAQWYPDTITSTSRIVLHDKIRVISF